MIPVRFLSPEEVLRLHQHLITAFGGDVGILNPGALESALAQPMMTAFGEFLHRDIVEQAAAYLFHLVANHPFCDGNKRIGLHATLVFLDTNGVEVLGEVTDWQALTMGAAQSLLKKRELTDRMRVLLRVPPAAQPKKP